MSYDPLIYMLEISCPRQPFMDSVFPPHISAHHPLHRQTLAYQASQRTAWVHRLRISESAPPFLMPPVYLPHYHTHSPPE